MNLQVLKPPKEGILIRPIIKGLWNSDWVPASIYLSDYKVVYTGSAGWGVTISDLFTNRSNANKLAVKLDGKREGWRKHEVIAAPDFHLIQENNGSYFMWMLALNKEYMEENLASIVATGLPHPFYSRLYVRPDIFNNDHPSPTYQNLFNKLVLKPCREHRILAYETPNFRDLNKTLLEQSDTFTQYSENKKQITHEFRQLIR